MINSSYQNSRKELIELMKDFGWEVKNIGIITVKFNKIKLSKDLSNGILFLCVKEHNVEIVKQQLNRIHKMIEKIDFNDRHCIIHLEGDNLIIYKDYYYLEEQFVDSDEINGIELTTRYERVKEYPLDKFETISELDSKPKLKRYLEDNKDLLRDRTNPIIYSELKHTINRLGKI